MSPHLAGTGCLGTGSPTLTSSPVKVAEVCTDGTRALKSLPHTSLSGLWGERGGPGAAQAEKPESFPPAGGTRGQTGPHHPLHFTEQPLYPAHWPNTMESELAQTFASSCLSVCGLESPPVAPLIVPCSPQASGMTTPSQALPTSAAILS